MSNVLQSELSCPFCGAVNTADKRYCRDCGRGLIANCPGCNGKNLVMEKFCGRCGTNIHEIVEEWRGNIEEAICRATDFWKSKKFGDALFTLSTQRKRAANSLLAVEREKIESLIQSISDEREKISQEAEQAYQVATQQLDNHAYAAAFATLESVSEDFRTDRSRELLEETKVKADQVAVLRKEILAGMRNNAALKLLPSVTELLKLVPSDSQAQNLVDQLSKLHCKAARRHLTNHRYREARILLDQIPELARDDTSKQLAEFATEIEFLMLDTTTSPYIDATLLEASERLKKLVPKDPRANQIREKLHKRVSTNGYKSKAVRHWAQTGESALGTPVRHFEGFERLKGECLSTSKGYLSQPGRFCVAAGLALQAIDSATIHTNLLPDDDSLKGRIAGLVRRKKRSNAGWGIDLSPSGLKAIKLSHGENEDELQVEECIAIENEQVTSFLQDQPQRQAQMRANVEQFTQGRELKDDPICLGIAGNKVLGWVLDLPKANPKKHQSAIEFEIKNRIPYPFHELNWDYQLLHHSHLANGNSIEVLVVAAKTGHADELLSVVTEAGLKVSMLQSDFLALYNFANHELMGDSGAVALLDVGTESSNIVIGTRESIWFRNIGPSSNAMTSTLAEAFKLDATAAEKVKRQPASLRRLSQFDQALRPRFADFMKELRMSLASHQQSRAQIKIDRLIGVGGGVWTHGLLRYLCNEDGKECGK